MKERKTTPMKPSAKVLACKVRHPEPVEGSVRPPLRKSSGTDPSASPGMTKRKIYRVWQRSPMVARTVGCVNIAWPLPMEKDRETLHDFAERGREERKPLESKTESPETDTSLRGRREAFQPWQCRTRERIVRRQRSAFSLCCRRQLTTNARFCKLNICINEPEWLRFPSETSAKLPLGSCSRRRKAVDRP